MNIALKEDQLEIALLVIIEDTLNQSLERMKEAEAALDGFEHKGSLKAAANKASSDHWANIMDLYDN